MKKLILLLAILATALIFAGCSKDSTPTANIGISKTVAVVDELPITAKEYQTFLHETYGEQAIAALTQEKIVEKWAKDEGVEPTPEKIEEMISQLKENGQYGAMISQVGEDKFNKSIKKQAMIIELSKKVTPLKEEETKKLYEQVKDQFKKPAGKDVEIIVFGNDKAVAEKNYELIKDIKDDKEMYLKIKDLKADNEKLQLVPQMRLDDKLPKEIVDAAKKLKDKEISGVTTIKGDPEVADSTLYLSVRVLEKPAINKTFEDAKSGIENEIAMMNLRTEEFNKAFEKRMKDAVIDIKIPEYKGVAEQIKNPKPQVPSMQPGMAPGMTPGM